ncbi:unnamed protein product [Mytilus edulis]|uniref:Uncharacterized protein n=1 Tax=Mytilus edulis TaxID=6550 RepID=A0A8S3THR0_MYTED|nr:unnamed protein product [Mytilus edulis]
MNSLYEENEIGCMSLMNTEDTVWGIRVAPVECAFDNGMIDVVGHPCVQRLLNRVWYKDSVANWSDWLKLKELLQFSWILIVFIVCAGVMYHSNMYPNHRDMWPQNGADMEHWRIWKILSLPYWQLYGELSLDQLRGETNSNGTCTSVESEWESNPDMERCVEYDWAIMMKPQKRNRQPPNSLRSGAEKKATSKRKRPNVSKSHVHSDPERPMAPRGNQNIIAAGSHSTQVMVNESGDEIIASTKTIVTVRSWTL